MGDSDKKPTESDGILDTVEEGAEKGLFDPEENNNLAKTPIQQFIEEMAEVEGELDEVNNISEYMRATHIPRLEKFIADHENPAYGGLKALLDNEIYTENNVTKELDKLVTDLKSIIIPGLRTNETLKELKERTGETLNEEENKKITKDYEDAYKTIIKIKNKIATKRNILSAIRQIITIVLKATPRIKKGSTVIKEKPDNDKEIFMVSSPESALDIIKKIETLKNSSDETEKAIVPVIRRTLDQYSNDVLLLKEIHKQERTIREKIQVLRQKHKDTQEAEGKAKIEEELKSLIQDRKGFLKLMETLYLQRNTSLAVFKKMIESLEE